MSRQEIQTNAGKVTIATLLSLIGITTMAFLFDIGGGGNIEVVTADEATTTVTVLNTPPAWTVPASELTAYPSATNSPTNVGTTTTWTAVATDANAENYFLLICNNASTPTAVESGPPECNGGSGNRWARSGTTTSGTQAVAQRTALAPDAESNDWYGWICDANAGSAQCETYSTGTGTAATASPFVVNHAATFTSVADDSPAFPGDLVTWTSVATDSTDVLRGAEQLQLHICLTSSFDATVPECTGGLANTWATSTLSGAANPSAAYTVAIPTQDRNFQAFAFVVDQFGLEATGVAQGSDTTLTVGNATPTITNIDLASGGNITLVVEQGETTGITMDVTVDDDNSCLNASSSDEITGIKGYVYRSGITQTGCDEFSEYNPNHCYPSDRPTSTWNFTCTASSTSCLGSSDSEMIMECTFPLWFIADATDATSEFPGDNWDASAVAIDDDLGLSSTSTDGATNELLQFLAFSATGSPIAYGSHQPGQGNATLLATTTLFATGNVGVDEQVFGDDMCITYPTCSGNSTSTIPAGDQQYSATSGLAYNDAQAIVLTNATSATLHIDVGKTRATATASSSDTYWGIEVPAAITIAGDYIGVNTLIGVVADLDDW